MKNLTISVPDEVYRRARVRAAETDTSVSAMVTDFLRSISDQEAEFGRLEALQRQVQDSIGRFTAGDRLDRDDLHARAVR